MRTARGSTVVVIAAWSLAACAPSTTHVKVVETLGPSRATTDPPSEHTLTASVAASEAGLTIGVEDTRRCARYDVRTATRREVRTKDINTFVTVFEYVMALGIGGAAGAALYDPGYVVENARPSFDLTTDDVRTGGYVGAGVGGTLFLFAVINTIRGGTTSKALPDQVRRKAKSSLVDCGRGPAAGTAVTLELGAERVPLGTTGAEGALAVTWDLIGDAAISAAASAGRGQIRVGGATGTAIHVDLAVAAKVAARRALGRAIAAGTLEALQTATTDPLVAAADPALLAAAADPLYDAAVTGRLETGDVPAARALLDDWERRAPASTRLVAQRTAVASFAAKGLGGVRWDQFQLALEAARQSGEAAAFDRAQQALAAFTAAAPGDASGAEGTRQLAKARKAADQARLAQAVKQAERARELARKGDFDGATAALAAADALAPGNAAVAHARARVAGRQQEAEARAARAEAKQMAAEAARAAAAERAAARQQADEDRAAAAEAKRRAAADAAAARRQAAADAAAAASRPDAPPQGGDAEDAAIARRKADEDRAAAAEAKRQAAADAAAARAEAAEARRLAAIVDAAARAEAKRRADEDRRAVVDARKPRDRRPVARGPGLHADDLLGLWATPVGDSLWLVELRPGGAARTALWQAGALTAATAAQWTAAGDALTLDVARQRVAAPAVRAGRGLLWLGVRWSRL